MTSLQLLHNMNVQCAENHYTRAVLHRDYRGRSSSLSLLDASDSPESNVQPSARTSEPSPERVIFLLTVLHGGHTQHEPIPRYNTRGRRIERYWTKNALKMSDYKRNMVNMEALTCTGSD